MADSGMVQLKEIIHQLVSDPRVRPVHISLSLALCQVWIDQEFKDCYHISRKRLMQFSHIRSIATYHRTLRELQLFGYLKYTPSYHPQQGSEVMLLPVNRPLAKQNGEVTTVTHP